MLVHRRDKGGYDMKKGIFSSGFLLVLCMGLAMSLFLGAKKAKKEHALLSQIIKKFIVQ